MRLLVLALTLLLGMTAAMAAPAKDAGAEVRAASAAEVKALLAADADTLAELWSDDFQVTNPFNRVLSKPQVLAMTRSGNLAFSSYDRTIEDVRIRGTTAVVIGAETVTWAGKMPPAGQQSNLRYTAVWMRLGGRWQQVARHANMVAP
jgi:ketosteroid isomerase-like protein